MCRYSVRKPPGKKIFVIDLSLAACFEKNGDCLAEVDVLKGTEVPQPGCNMTIDYSGAFINDEI